MELLARAADALNVMLQILNRITATFGQQISPEKSKVMVISSSSFDKPKNTQNGCELEVVDSFKYLGSIEESTSNIPFVCPCTIGPRHTYINKIQNMQRYCCPECPVRKSSMASYEQRVG